MDNSMGTYFLSVRGERPNSMAEYQFSLGPWERKQDAVAYSDSLTDTRIGEQLLTKLGIVSLQVYEA